MRLGSLVEVRVDDRLVGSFKKESNDLMRFQKYINAGTGRHRLEIRLVQNEPGAARVTAIGIGDSSAILLKTANSDNLARNGNLQFSYNRVDPPNKRLIETIRDDLNQHFDPENYPLDSIVFKTRLNGLDSSIQETRRSVNLFPGSSISYQTQLTENPLILEFSYGYFEWGQSPENSFIVKISSEGDNPINRAHGYQLRDLRKGNTKETNLLDIAKEFER